MTGSRCSLTKTEEAILAETGAHVGGNGDHQAVVAYRRMLVESGALKIAEELKKPFRLRNGTRSFAYIDHGNLLCQPETNMIMVNAVGQYVSQTFKGSNVVLANVDSKASPQLTGAVAVTGRYRQIVVLPDLTYRREKGMNLRLRMPDELNAEDKIVIIDDVHTPRDVTARNVADLIRSTLAGRLGAAIKCVEMHLVVGVARDPGSIRSELAGHGIEPHWLTTMHDLLETAWPRLGNPQREALEQEFFYRARKVR